MSLLYAHSRGMHNTPRALERLGSRSFTSTTHSATATATAPQHHSKELSLTSKVVIASVTSCFGVAILIVLGFCFYGRYRRRYNTKHHSFEFDKDAFAKSTPSPGINEYMAADLMKLSGSALRPESSVTSTSEDRTLGRQPQGEVPLRVANADEDEKVTNATLAFPKPVAEKGKLPRGKPAWLNPITTEEGLRSPPPAYGVSSAGQEILIPIPPQRPPQKPEATSVPSTPPVKSKTSLAIPDFEPVPVISPARSESFAPKDLTPPSPPNPPASSTSGSGLDPAGSQIGSSRVGHDINMKLPRLMNVVALFTPNLPDELRVKIGDTVRIIEEYKDGWCFVQFLGRRDAPKGLVPLVCLQERKRLVPFTHNASNSSLTSLNWRGT